MKNGSGTIKPIVGKIKSFIPFPRGISQKVNVIVQQEFELAYYHVSDQYVHHYTKVTSPCEIF